ncbi:hypothetical protein H0H93_009011 [Arthromyces matolae]|nr:hypothetical protein H0H93_009011 [Arthromyces matolae]
MVARALLLRQLRHANHLSLQKSVRYYAKRVEPAPQSPARPTQQQQSWLTRKVKSSPAAMKIFVGLTNLFGYNSPKQIAARRSFVLYEHVVAATPDVDTQFWHQACHLPPTFQSWFTVTNLHIWMLTVRLRSLPEGKYYTQALIDHFFIDIEDRIRAVLQPKAVPSKPYTFHSSFYINPNAPSTTESKDSKQRSKLLARAPDKLVTRQMKIFKEQWAGLGMSLDLGLVNGDMEMAAAVWRNLLGARGAQGIAFPDPISNSTKKTFRRSVNLVGGEVVNVAKVDISKEETRDDGSGVHDFLPEEADLYLEYPQLMLDIVGYLRRELVRLEKLSDQQVMSGPFEHLKFGRVRSK